MASKKKETALRVLESAFRIVKDPNKWIQEYEALDDQSESVDPDDKQAVKFCSLGAVKHIDGTAEEKAIRLLRTVAKQICKEQGLTLEEGDDPIITVNDDDNDFGKARANVLNMFQRAILLAKLEKQ